MTVQHEIKSQLAKLLATEDIIVEHKKVENSRVQRSDPCAYTSNVGEGK